MTRLMRTSEITALPVVTLAGDDVAQVKDIDLSLRPIGTLDPPVLLALPYIRTVALDAGAAS